MSSEAPLTLTTPLAAGATLGVFGGGQLGRMFCEAAAKLGFRTHVYSPDSGGPAAQVADLHTSADYHDFAEVDRFARSVQAVTLEFENVPVAAVEAAGRHTRVRPSGEVLFTVQDRLREKRFLAGAGVPVAPFASVRTAGECYVAIDQIGVPAVLKTTKFGYDGKGQAKIDAADKAVEAWDYLGRHACVLEGFVDFAREVSVIVARGADGGVSLCGPIENDHANHILDVSVLPASCSEESAAKAREIAKQVATELDLVGVLCVEFFETQDGQMIVNEIAPRPHNSGHLTIEGCEASQFEQQARAMAGLPLASMDNPRPVAMANLLGDLWADGEPKWEAAKAIPGVNLHLYGKGDARPGRKMGHLTAVADTVEAAREAVLAARRALTD
ncbi:N5-carboxyaminoimidazole ribonucleotide synthase [Posidoniimonas polymericola]|uniref:N5-carboxyaminoimidazole ribonucleotide synthase n=1 Tax=Posidoniimonas polymericola TaxID=2528002 RepID=A0A5C5YCL8_9BACT|nr:5-(carboxyamino)imidazole ribonucleotide synthase [Posidoniimonas polymericola]TWT73446.1 N5-carboxyaminoimidazole ribonucleotide synthase [Posidoniimonas polymericola]